MCCRFKCKTDNGTPGDFPYSVNVCSSCKRMFVVCLFVYGEKNGSYPFAN